MADVVQETLSLIVPNGKVSATRTEIHAMNVTQGSLGGGPIGKNRPGGNVQELEGFLRMGGGHGENLGIATKAQGLNGGGKIENRFRGGGVVFPRQQQPFEIGSQSFHLRSDP